MIATVIVNPGRVCGFERCPVDPCVLRLRLPGDVGVTMVFHVDIEMAACKGVTKVVLCALGQIFPADNLE